VKLVPGFVSRQKVETVREYLTALDEARWANDYRLSVLPIENSAGADGCIRVTLANLVALPAEKYALLLAND